MREAVEAMQPGPPEGQAVLGQGIARYVLAQVGVVATVASALDLQAVKSALALRPAVVIFESTEPLLQLDLGTLAPQAVMIDVSTVVARGSATSPGAAGLEKILQAVRSGSGA